VSCVVDNRHVISAASQHTAILAKQLVLPVPGALRHMPAKRLTAAHEHAELTLIVTLHVYSLLTHNTTILLTTTTTQGASAAGSDGRETALCGAALPALTLSDAPMADEASTVTGDSPLGVFITGSASGHLHWWRGRRAERTTKAHAVSFSFATAL
jgi:hypothetical protein